MTINDARDLKRPVRTRTKEQFKADLVEAARRLFLERGVQGTSMADLGRELGVSKPTVYEAFENKQALIDAVFHSD
jgi:AcrR family transcriptional regulator